MPLSEMLLRGLWASHAVPTSGVDSPVSSIGDLDVSDLHTVDSMSSVSPSIAILEEGRRLDIETSGNNCTRKVARVFYDVTDHVCDDDISYASDSAMSTITLTTQQLTAAVAGW